MCEIGEKIEIMSPVGSFESLMAAIQAGAGSVYFGAGKLNMRSRSSVNFTLEDLKEIARLCRENDVKSYLALNTVIFDHELPTTREIIDEAKKTGVSAIIASDISVILQCREAGMEVHLSTQCNITNLGAVRFYSAFADVIVTARELELKQVAEICRGIREERIKGPSGELLRIEVFVHGALCMAVSGKCYLSLDNYNHSANRGECLQPCRRSYLVTEKESGMELEVDNEYIMSPKDLKTIHFLDKILEAGVRVLKIEGRGRSPEYVKTVTKCYKEAVESIQDGTYSQGKVEEWDRQLDSVYNRGFWDGYYLGQKTGEWAAVYGSMAKKRKKIVGKITNYFSKLSVAEMKLDASNLQPGDAIMIIGPTTGVYEDIIREIHLDSGPAAMAVKGENLAFPVSNVVRKGDKVYKILDATSEEFETQ